MAIKVTVSATALLAVCLLGQLAHCQSECDVNYPNSGGLSIDGNVEVVDNLLSLVDGLYSQREIMVCRCNKENSFIC